MEMNFHPASRQRRTLTMKRREPLRLSRMKS